MARGDNRQTQLPGFNTMRFWHVLFFVLNCVAGEEATNQRIIGAGL